MIPTFPFLVSNTMLRKETAFPMRHNFVNEQGLRCSGAAKCIQTLPLV